MTKPMIDVEGSAAVVADSGAHGVAAATEDEKENDENEYQGHTFYG